MLTLARAYALLRGAMLLLFSAFLLFAPEKALPGSSTEPARSLALMFASRTILLGAALVIATIAGRRKGVGWLLFADPALQVFDTGLALAMHKYNVVVLPAALGALDVWAGRALVAKLRE